MITTNDRDFERFIQEFGENVAARYATLPPLPGPEFRWRLVAELEYEGDHMTLWTQWVAEPCEASEQGGDQ